MEPIYWLMLMVVLLVIELLTLGLTTIWFAGGALAAFFFGLFHVPLPLQAGVFAGVSVILLLFTRPLAARFLNRRTEKTNLDSLIGKTAVVTEEIDNRKACGMVKLDGVAWSARVLEERAGSAKREEGRIPVGTTVRVEAIQGVKLMVSEINEEE